MDTTSWIIVSVVIVLGGLAAFYFLRKRNLEKLFTEVYITSKQVPKKQKRSFLLLMFKESLSYKKKKTGSSMDNLNNPKYVQVQLIQMNAALKDPSKVTDKKMKQALQMLNDYTKWEKEKNSASKEVKAS